MHPALTLPPYTVRLMGGPNHGNTFPSNSTPRTMLAVSGGAYIRYEVDDHTRTAVYKWRTI